MGKLVISLPSISEVFEGRSLREAFRHIEDTFAKIFVDTTRSETPVTGNYTVTRDDALLLVDTSAGNVTVTLSEVSQSMVDIKRTVIIKKVSPAFTLTLLPTANDTLDGYTGITVSSGNVALDFRAVTGGWKII